MESSIHLQPQDFAGATVSGDVPLSDALVNRLIRERLTGKTGPIVGIRFEALDDDQVVVYAALPSPLPEIRVLARIDRQPQPDAPVLGLTWSMPSIGPLAFLASPVLQWFKKLPSGVRVEGDRLALDLRELATSSGHGAYLAYLTHIELHTRRGAILVRFAARV